MINRENKFNDEPVTSLSVASFYIEIATALANKKLYRTVDRTRKFSLPIRTMPH